MQWSWQTAYAISRQFGDRLVVLTVLRKDQQIVDNDGDCISVRINGIYYTVMPSDPPPAPPNLWVKIKIGLSH